MAYLLGNKACMESLLSDVQDIHWTVGNIISRVGPLDVRSWKFPDQTACNVDIDDLLDLYSCDDDNDDAEEKQVAHIALYELVIDRLLLLVQATAKYADSNLGSGLVTAQANEDKNKMAGSVGLVVKQFWTQISKLQSLYQQLQSENKSKESKVHMLEKELQRPSVESHGETSCLSLGPVMNENIYSPLPKTPGTLGIIPPNKADMVFMGLASAHEKDLSISRDTNNKSCQTYETCLVPCESCEFVQRKMREAGDIVIKVCSDQGLPCSLKKFKTEVSHVETLLFGDICRWMAEQNKDIARIGKQTELLKASIDPMKKEVKVCERKVREAEENAKMYENNMKEEKQTQAVLRQQIEVKMKDQEKQHQEWMDEEARQKNDLKRGKEKLEQEMKSLRDELKSQEEDLKALELEYKVLDKELKEKSRIALKTDGLHQEVANLKESLEEVTARLDTTSQALARERGKGRSAFNHNESLQAKQESLLARMDRLGQENEDLTQQVASLEENKSAFDDMIAELKMETKELRKKVKQNEVIIRNLESEKKALSNSVKESMEAVTNLEAKLEEAKERERMIVEYPDLNGPVNPDLNGTGDIMVDMQNQVTANTIRMRLLEEQNSSLGQSIRKLSGMQMNYGGLGMRHETGQKHAAVQPIPLWQQDQSMAIENQSNTNNHANVGLDLSHTPSPPRVKQHAWTFESQKDSPTKSGRQGKHSYPDPSQEFLVGQAHSSSALGQHGSRSSRRPMSGNKQGRPSSAKMRTVNAPVNATPIGAYTQMKQALGILSGMEKPKRGQSSASRPSSGKPPVSVPVSGNTSSGHEPSSPFSCPRCDKMYIKARDLDIHLSYCTSPA